MTDLEADFATLWLRFKEGRVSSSQWAQLCLEHPGLQRWARQQREREIDDAKKQTPRQMRNAFARAQR